MSKTSGPDRRRDAVPRVTFRNYRGTEDIPVMVGSENACWKADLVDAITTEDDLLKELATPVNIDPSKDIIFAEVEGGYAGHAMLDWRLNDDGSRQYFLYAFISEKWRGKGVREELVRRSERHLREVAATHSDTHRKYFETYANTKRNDWRSLIEREGYKPAWHLFEMVRPNLEDIPDYPLPEGVEVRAVRPEDYKTIWEGMKEAFRDERFFSGERHGDKALERMINHRLFVPQFWQVAWDGDEVVGGVWTYVNPEENESFRRKWGHTEEVFVRRRWRNKGVAAALLTRSLRVVRDLGMEAATLDVDTENPSGALRLYKKLGYKQKIQFSFYRKDL